jgi:hypothetical protein
MTNYLLPASLLLLSVMAINSPLMAGKILTINNTEVESSEDSIALCEKLFETCQKNNYCKEADHCACAPHCCLSGDCRALCKDDVADFCPTMTTACHEGPGCVLVVGLSYVPAHIAHHFVHAANKRIQSTESKKME